MTLKQYEIFLGDKKIGMTELEKSDAPMGVVYGKIIFISIISGYDFLKNYCLANRIEIMADYPYDRFIATADIPNLKVIDKNAIEIKGQATTIEGMDGDGFEVKILGISYPFFEEEFPHHVKSYDAQFKDKNLR